MPTDTAREERRIAAPVDEVLAAIHDVASQPEWIPEIRELVVLDVDDEGLVTRAALAASTAVGTDHYTLRYTHDPDGVRWSLETGGLQSRQDGALTAAAAAGGTSATATYELTVEHPLPLPGFVRSRVIRGLVAGTLDGLRARLEAS